MAANTELCLEGPAIWDLCQATSVDLSSYCLRPETPSKARPHRSVMDGDLDDKGPRIQGLKVSVDLFVEIVVVTEDILVDFAVS